MAVSTRITLRLLEPSDVEVFSAFAMRELSAFAHLPEWICKVEAANYSPSRCRERTTDQGTLMVTAWDGGTPLGFIHGVENAGVAWIPWIVVGSEHRKRNIAWYLFRKFFAEARARGAHRLWATVRESNLEAQRAAKAVGFTVLCRLPCYWHGLDYLLVDRAL